MSYFSYPPPPPLPPPPPPPPVSDTDSTASPLLPVPPIDQVQELLSNPSEVQDILKKIFGASENQNSIPPEACQMQSHLTSSLSFHSQSSMPINNAIIHSTSPTPSNYNSQTSRVLPPITGSQPYNSSLAFMQGNRRHLPPLQKNDRCFASSTNKNNKQQPNRSFSFSSSSNTNGIMPLLANTSPPLISAPPLMQVNPAFSYVSSMTTRSETTPSNWSNKKEQQRHFHPFWCATCMQSFPNQIAYQEHLQSHIPVRHLIITF